MAAVADYQRDLDRMHGILPTWFVGRMIDDEWSFGLLLVTGQMLAIAHIVDVRQAADGSIWLDVRMLDLDDVDSLTRSFSGLKHWPKALGAPTSRLQASVNAAQVVCAFDIADT